MFCRRELTAVINPNPSADMCASHQQDSFCGVKGRRDSKQVNESLSPLRCEVSGSPNILALGIFGFWNFECVMTWC